EVEGDHPREVELGLLVEADQLPVQPERGRAGGQAEHGGALGGVVLADEAFEHQGHVPRGVGAVREDQGGDLGVGHVVRGHVRRPTSKGPRETAYFPLYTDPGSLATDNLPARRTTMHAISINGETHTFDTPVTVAELLDRLGYDRKRIAVEVNREV